MAWNSVGDCHHRGEWKAFDRLPRSVRDVLNAAIFQWCSVCCWAVYKEYLHLYGCPETATALVIQTLRRMDAADADRREHDEQRRERRQRQARRQRQVRR
jgi:hypothetical protein